MTPQRTLALITLVLTSLAGCGGSPDSGPIITTQMVVFPVLAERADVGSLGMVGGRLVVQGPCLLLAGGEGSPKTLPVWPHGSLFHQGPGILRGPDGRMVARLGDEVLGTGGEGYSYEHLQEIASQEIPRDCGEPVTYAVMWTFDPTLGGAQS